MRDDAREFARRLVLASGANCERRKSACYLSRMKNLSSLSDAELLDSTRLHLQRSRALDADLLLLLGEIDARRLYAERAFPSMFAFCTGELGFSEDVACNRLEVARLARRFPKILDVVRTGQIHLTGLRLLAPHLTEENFDEVLAAAVGKSKRDIEELVARLAPKPPVPTSIRKLPELSPRVAVEPPSLPLLVMDAASVEVPLLAPSPALERKPEVQPLAADAFLV